MSGNCVRLVILEHSIPDILSIPPADLPKGNSNRDEALRFSARGENRADVKERYFDCVNEWARTIERNKERDKNHERK